jgi:hypothetical protein
MLVTATYSASSTAIVIATSVGVDGTLSTRRRSRGPRDDHRVELLLVSRDPIDHRQQLLPIVKHEANWKQPQCNLYGHGPAPERPRGVTSSTAETRCARDRTHVELTAQANVACQHHVLNGC